MSSVVARRLHIQGRVQGIGFRPELYRRAIELEVAGWVQNDPAGVIVHIEGEAVRVLAYVQSLQDNPPLLALYTSFSEETVPVEHREQFVIKESRQAGSGLTDVSPDLALCPACQADLTDVENRRYQYPFTTCTYCGPRYTFIKQMPYDRPFTTMADFPLCPDCQQEYRHPLDHRFHAQPIACPTCGPKLRLYRHQQQEGFTQVNGDVIELTRLALMSGAIVGVKGLGGYHLAASAQLDYAVTELRRRKHRPDKPLALMMRDIATVHKYCELSTEEEAWLLDKKAPILLVRKKSMAPYLAEQIAANSTRLGVMLPYTPVQHLLLSEELPVLIMTSANLSGQPILADEQSWFELPACAQMVDYLLTDNRPIANPVDDSVIELVQAGQAPLIHRRSRGYVPESVAVSFESDGILAVGAEQHAAFAMGRSSRIYHGPYTGTLAHIEIQERYLASLKRYQQWFQPQFTQIACDLHPGYWSTIYAHKLASDQNLPIIAVQHHHAHMAAVMAEHGLTEECFAIVLDGTGFGLDGTIWGMEILHGNCESFTRVASLQPIPLLGGEAAIRETWRIALALLLSCSHEQEAEVLLDSIDKTAEGPMLLHMLKHKLNTPLASSCGRLFDGVSALLSICQNPSFDSQAAIELAEAAERWSIDNQSTSRAYSYQIDQVADRATEVDPLYRMSWQPMIKDILLDQKENRSVEKIARRFHQTVVDMLVEGIQRATSSHVHANWSKTRSVILAGGSIQNRILLQQLINKLTGLGYCVYRPELYPAGDGGIAVGQIAVAAAKRKKEGTPCVSRCLQSSNHV